MTRGGHSRIAKRLVTATAMVALGVAVVGGGVAFASDYRVDTPTAELQPTDPGDQGSVVATASVWEWT